MTINLRLIGMVGGVILMLGILLMASQRFAGLTGGASADVVNYDQLPAEITLTQAQYKEAMDLLGEYSSRDDLASKNEIVTELREVMSGWAK